MLANGTVEQAGNEIGMHFDTDVPLPNRCRAQVEQSGGTCADKYDLVLQGVGANGLVDDIFRRNIAKTFLRSAKRDEDRRLLVDRDNTIAQPKGFKVNASPTVVGEHETDCRSAFEDVDDC